MRPAFVIRCNSFAICCLVLQIQGEPTQKCDSYFTKNNESKCYLRKSNRIIPNNPLQLKKSVLSFDESLA